MGREIRRVPLDWEHPKRKQPGGYGYVPMLDKDYNQYIEDVALYVDDCRLWRDGKHPDQLKYPDAASKHQNWWDWDGDPPSPSYYRPVYTSDPVGYQFYENVSEGTPLSPVFENEAGLREWLIEEEGCSPDAVDSFIKHGSAPSFVFADGLLLSGIEAIGLMDRESGDEQQATE